MQPAISIDFRADSFFYFPSESDWRTWSIEDPVRVFEIPTEVDDPNSMMELIVASILNVEATEPRVARVANLNAFRDVLGWPEAMHPRTLLLHHNSPDPQALLTKQYLEVISEYLGDWMGDGRCLWAVGFPESARETIVEIMSD